MADLVYRGNLKAASFPFLSELFGRSVIVKGQDQNYVGGLANKESLDSAVGVPQIYYCHNVVPTDSGYKSVGYESYSVSGYSSGAGFDNVFTIRDGSGNTALITKDAVGNVYVMERGTTVWTIPTTPPSPATVVNSRITVAFVSGVSYIYFSNVGCYTYDWTTNAMSSVTLTGLTAADIIGVVGNSGYLLAYSIDAIAWSSTIDATDFVPSLTTGAGGGNVEGIRGQIVTAEEVYGGIIIFAQENCVAAVFSNNVRYPYNFTAITAGGGLTNYHHVAQDSGSGSLYAYTTSGLQQINLKSATAVFPEVTDYISGALFEDYNELTNELELIDASGIEVQKRLVLVADRYLILSYGVNDLNYALYYDVSYKQWGRLKYDHTDVFEFTHFTAGTVEVPKRSAAFLKSNGDIDVLNTDIVSTNSNGVLLLGKFQFVRTRLMTLQQIEIENIEPAATFSFYIFPSFDGKTLEAANTPTLAQTSGKTRRYATRLTALNHTIAWVGNFNAVSFVLTFTVHGGR